MYRIVLILCLSVTSFLAAMCAHAALPAAQSHGHHFENQFISLRIVPGWTVAPSDHRAQDCCILTLTQGRYVLAINPLFDHAGPIAGGRFSEIINDQPSVRAVMGDVVIPAGGFECTLTPLPETRVNRAITLEHLFTDPEKAKDNQYGCHFPAKPLPVWFASFFGGEGAQIDYNITLTYDSTDINALPLKDSPELARVFDQVARMLRTLRLKPPVVITKVVPTSAPPGATVTVYGSGLAMPGQRASAIFGELPNSAKLVTRVADDGKSLTFVVPGSITIIACPPGETDVNEHCVAPPRGHLEMNDCPPDRHESCSVPIPPATYHVSILEEGMGVGSNALLFTVTAPPQSPISLFLLSPAYYLLRGEYVTLRGSGFTPNGNTVHIGSVLVPELSASEGSIRLRIPDVASRPGQTFPIFVSNTNGVSNVLTLGYR